jgi:hypothetical protein
MKKGSHISKMAMSTSFLATAGPGSCVLPLCAMPPAGSKTLLDENNARHITKKQKIEGKTIRFKVEMSASEDSPDIRFKSFRAFVSCSHMIFLFTFYDEYVLLFLHCFSKWYYQSPFY